MNEVKAIKTHDGLRQKLSESEKTVEVLRKMSRDQIVKNVELEEEKRLVKRVNRSNARIVRHLEQESIRLKATIRHLRLQIRTGIDVND